MKLQRTHSNTGWTNFARLSIFSLTVAVSVLSPLSLFAAKTNSTQSTVASTDKLAVVGSKGSQMYDQAQCFIGLVDSVEM